MPRVIVFAGAGASKAVNPSEYPTTIEFFDRLPALVTNDQLFGLMTKFLRRGKPPNAPVDIEQVLWALQELEAFLESVTNPSALAGWFLQDSRLLQPLSLSSSFNNLTDNGQRILEIARKLRDQINTVVYDFYGRVALRGELEDNWIYLLDDLLARGADVDIVTTNYDRNIEVALRYLPPKYHNVIDTGRRDEIERVLDEKAWTESPPSDSAPRRLLTKLHGSVDWSWDREQSRILVSDPLFKGAHERHVILYPGFKGIPDRPPFNFFHAYFAKILAEADHVVFIGFAFRDEYINEMIRRYLADRAKVTCLNPMRIDSSVTKRFQHIEQYFDSGGAESVLMHIWPPGG